MLFQHAVLTAAGEKRDTCILKSRHSLGMFVEDGSLTTTEERVMEGQANLYHCCRNHHNFGWGETLGHSCLTNFLLEVKNLGPGEMMCSRPPGFILKAKGMRCRKISLGVLSSWTWYNHEEIGQEGGRGRWISIWHTKGYARNPVSVNSPKKDAGCLGLPTLHMTVLGPL